MQTACRIRLMFLLALIFIMTVVPAIGQQVIATVNVGAGPTAVAVNAAANKIFVPNGQAGTLTVIDGLTDNTSLVTVGTNPGAVAVNPATNKAYVANSNSGTVTVIDGATLGTTTVTVGAYPLALAVDVATNKIYVVNKNSNSVTVIDGASNNTTSVTVGNGPNFAAVNSVTNKIFVANLGKSGCGNNVTVIDGPTNTTTSVTVGACPTQIAVNSVTNKIYVTNNHDNNVTVIDGASLTTTTVPVGTSPVPVVVNAVTNKIYVANSNGTITVIDGASLTTTTVNLSAGGNALAVNPVTNTIYATVTDQMNKNYVTVIDGATNSIVTNLPVGSSPLAVVVNSVTDRIYAVNHTSNTVSVIAGVAVPALQFISVTPCRLLDTRTQNGGGGPIQGGTYQSFNLPQLAQAKGCASLASAAAYSLNVTVVPQNGTPVGYLSIWPTGEDQPIVSTMNSLDGRVKANAAIVPAGYQGNVSVYVTDTANVVLDIDGYFAPLPNPNALAFYPLTPCRVADTRQPNFPPGLGTPHLSAGVPRDFPVLSSTCIPVGVNALAYSFNFTVVPYPALGQPLGYLEVWPKDQKPQSPVSTLNNTTGTIVANAALVPAGTNGEITGYANNDTEVVIDIDGYFAAPGAGGLSLYTMAPCRVLDTRKAGGVFRGTLPVPVVNSPCALPAAAQGYVLNATVVPPGALGYLTLWPDGQPQPIVSTLNAYDGAITSNMAIVPTTNGSIDAFASDPTQLLLDINSYFAP